jgi:hypothetical protein
MLLHGVKWTEEVYIYRWSNCVTCDFSISCQLCRSFIRAINSSRNVILRLAHRLSSLKPLALPEIHVTDVKNPCYYSLTQRFLFQKGLIINNNNNLLIESHYWILLLLLTPSFLQCMPLILSFFSLGSGFWFLGLSYGYFSLFSFRILSILHWV